MKKRKFIQASALLTGAALVNPFYCCETKKQASDAENADPKTTYKLPALPYEFAALEPHIDHDTMRIHHDLHHQGYVNKLNKALEGSAFAQTALTDIFGRLRDEATTTAIRNNSGGHYNHSLFWQIMTPNSEGIPSGKLAEAINAQFSSFDGFKEIFFKTAKSVFGSGWSWLCVDNSGKLFVTSTPNQDNPLMAQLVERAGKPILCIDVWEHAYYLNYQNKRGDYINAFFKLINWRTVAEKFDKASA